MFLGLTPLTRIRSFEHRLAQHGRRAHRSQCTPDRTRARFQLEGLEERCLLSGISSITEYNLPPRLTRLA